jgi:hypothetical protein
MQSLSLIMPPMLDQLIIDQEEDKQAIEPRKWEIS